MTKPDVFCIRTELMRVLGTLPQNISRGLRARSISKPGIPLKHGPEMLCRLPHAAPLKARKPTHACSLRLRKPKQMTISKKILK